METRSQVIENLFELMYLLEEAETNKESKTDQFLEILKECRRKYTREQFSEIFRERSKYGNTLLELAEKNNPTIKTDIKRYKAFITEEIHADLFQAVKRGDIDSLEKCLRELNQEIPLEKINLLIQLINQQKLGETLLNEAIRGLLVTPENKQKFKIVQLLLMHGASLNTISSETWRAMQAKIGKTDAYAFFEARQRWDEMAIDLPIDLSFELILSALSDIKNSDGSMCALVLGASGDGKSTFLNYLRGVTYQNEAISSYISRAIPRKDAKEEIFAVGHSSESKTIMPSGTVIDGVRFIDTVGTEGTKGLLELPGFLYLNLLKKMHKTVVLIYVLDIKRFEVGHHGSETLVEAANRVFNLIQYGESYEGMFFVLTKGLSNRLDEIKSKIENVKEGMENGGIDGKHALPIINVLHNQPEKILIPNIFDPDLRQGVLDTVRLSSASFPTDQLDFSWLNQDLLNKFKLVSKLIVSDYLRMRDRVAKKIPDRKEQITSELSATHQSMAVVQTNLDSEQGWLKLYALDGLESPKAMEQRNIAFQQRIATLDEEISAKKVYISQWEERAYKNAIANSLAAGTTCAIGGSFFGPLGGVFGGAACGSGGYFITLYTARTVQYDEKEEIRKTVLPKLEDARKDLFDSLKSPAIAAQHAKHFKNLIESRKSSLESLRNKEFQLSGEKLALDAELESHCLVLVTHMHLFRQLEKMEKIGIIDEQWTPELSCFVEQVRNSLIPTDCEKLYPNFNTAYTIFPGVHAFEPPRLFLPHRLSELELSQNYLDALVFWNSKQPGSSERHLCSVLNKYSLFCLDSQRSRILYSRIPEFWEMVQEDNFLNCKSVSINGIELKHCKGKSTSFIEFDTSSGEFLMASHLLLISTLRGALLTAAVEFVGDLLCVTRYCEEKQIKTVKLMLTMGIIFSTGSFLPMFSGLAMMIFLQHAGCSATTANIGASAISVGVNLGKDMTALSVASTFAAYAGGKVGFWIENKLFQQIEESVNDQLHHEPNGRKLAKLVKSGL